MRVKVHPHRSLVNAGVEACVSITPDRKHGRAYYMGTVCLTDVEFRIHQSGVERARAERQRNVHAWAVGSLDYEFDEQLKPSDTLRRRFSKVTYHYDIGRFIAEDGTDVSDGRYRAAYFCGRDFYISKEW